MNVPNAEHDDRPKGAERGAQRAAEGRAAQAERGRVERGSEAGGHSERPTSIWDELRDDPLLEPTEAVRIERTFPRHLFGTFYDHLGGLILVNLAVTIQGLLGLVVGVFLAAAFHAGGGAALALMAIGACLALGPAFAGLFNYVRAICDEDALSSLRDYPRGMRTYGGRGLLLLALQLATGAILALNLRFYTSFHSLIGLAIVFLVLMLLLVWAMAGIYAWPLLVRGAGWGLLLRNSLFLALAAPFSTVALLLGLSLVSGVLLLTRVGWVLLGFSAWALTENVALQRLVRTFRARQEQGPDAGQDTAPAARAQDAGEPSVPPTRR